MFPEIKGLKIKYCIVIMAQQCVQIVQIMFVWIVICFKCHMENETEETLHTKERNENLKLRLIKHFIT